MQQKTDPHIFQGMQRDIDPNKQPGKYYIDASNIRLLLDETGGNLAITSERFPSTQTLVPYESIKGTIETTTTGTVTTTIVTAETVEITVTVDSSTSSPSHSKVNTNVTSSTSSSSTTIDYGSHIIGNYKGHCVLNNYLVIFTYYSITTLNYIYRIDIETLELVCLYAGDLNIHDRVETFASYENSLIQKVYWTDGTNQPRVINIMQAELKGSSYETIRASYAATTTPFDFTPELALNESVSITKSASSSGSFPAGVVQYVLTYYNKYMQESNIAWVSQLLYTSFNDRAGSPEETIGNSFTLSFNNLDTNFDYARLYSIARTSLDATPTVKRVTDFPIKYYESNDTDSLTVNISKYNQAFDTIEEWRAGYVLNASVDSSSGANYTYTISDSTAIGNYSSLLLNRADENFFEGTVTAYVFTYTDFKDCLFRFYANTTRTYVYYKFDSSASSGYEIRIYTNTATKNRIGSYIIGCYTSSSSTTSVGYIDVLTPGSVSTTSYTFTDDNTYGETVDPTYLLYVGGEEVSAQTICQKDGTMFLGNVAITRPSIDSIPIKSTSASPTISINTRGVTYTVESDFYPYVNTLNLKDSSNNIVSPLTFKNGETYRLGLQFQYKNGKWSEPKYLTDKQMTTASSYTLSTSSSSSTIAYDLKFPYFKYDYDLSEFLDAGYKKVRPVVVIPSLAERQVIAQGLLCPTVYSIKDRALGTPYVQSSWFTRIYHNYSIDSDSYSYYNSGGNYIQCSHNYTLTSGLRQREIQGVPNALSNISTSSFPSSIIWYDSDGTATVSTEESDCGNVFAVDQQTITFHSPDILWNEDMSTIDWTTMNMYYVGYASFSSGYCAGDITIETSSPTISSDGIGFTHYATKGTGARVLCSGLFYDDYLVDDSGNDEWPIRWYKYEEHPVKYVVYPWHKSGSLNNDVVRPTDTGTRSAVLSKKIISNIHISSSSIWKTSQQLSLDSGTYISLFNSDEVTACKLGTDLYYGNINTALSPIVPYGSIFAVGSTTLGGEAINVSITDDSVFGTLVKNGMHTISIAGKIGSSTNFYVDGDDSSDIGDKNATTGLRVNKDFISMKYKSTPHLVMRLGSALTSSPGYSTETLLLAEIRRSSAPTFGGSTEAALQNNKWIVAGPAVDIEESGKKTTIHWYYGDTFYQRWDCLKTYAYTQEDENQIVDIVSFLVESRVNCDGRYDKNRGQSSNLYMSPTNFNLHNPVYNQLDTFFTYRTLDSDYYKLTSYPNTITWSTEKTNGSEVDPWTDVTMASTLDINGSKGQIRKLEVNNNHIYCFQDKAISEVSFNARTQINTTDGVPIEISNNYKVDGVNYLTDNIGSNYKWNICNTPSGIYFLDSQSKELYNIGGSNGLVVVSATHNMSSWFKSLDTTSQNLWYDYTNSDLYIQTPSEVLNYSELVGEFVSFFPLYNSTIINNMISINGELYATNTDFLTSTLQYTEQALSKLRAVDFGESDHYFVFNGLPLVPTYDFSFISNDEAATEKLFTNINVRGDWYSDGEIEHNTTFNTMQVSNEYQDTGTVNISYDSTSHSTNIVKKKFRVWRFNIPRNSSSRDRISNMWAKVKLTSTKPMRIHDLDVQYYVR